MSKKKFAIFSGVGMLVFCSILAKIFGAIYRIPLTNILGVEGIGLYQMVFPVYTVVLTIASGGMSSAIARIIAKKKSENNVLAMKRIFKVALLSMVIVGLFFTILLMAFCTLLSNAQKNYSIYPCYIAIAPSIFFVCIISVYRGYFQGLQNITPAAIGQLVEQVIKLFLGLGLALYLIRYGAQYGVLGAIIGITLSEMMTFFVMLGYHYFKVSKVYKENDIMDIKANVDNKLAKDNHFGSSNIGQFEALTNAEFGVDIAMDDIEIINTEFKKNNSLNFEKDKEIEYKKDSVKKILRDLYSLAIVASIGALILPITQVIDSIVVVNIFVKLGFSRYDATVEYGLINGPVSSLVNMPSITTIAIAMCVLPIVASNIEKDMSTVNKCIYDNLKLVLIITLPVVLYLIVFSDNIMKLLYGNSMSELQIYKAADLLKISAISVVLIGLIQVFTSVLQGAGNAKTPMINLLIGGIIKVILTVLLLPFIGIYGSAIATVCCLLVATFLDAIFIKKRFCIGDGYKFCLQLFVVAILSSLIGFFIIKILNSYTKSVFLKLGIAGGFAFISYVVMCMFLKIIDIKKIIFKIENR